MYLEAVERYLDNCITKARNRLADSTDGGTALGIRMGIHSFLDVIGHHYKTRDELKCQMAKWNPWVDYVVQQDGTESSFIELERIRDKVVASYEIFENDGLGKAVTYMNKNVVLI